MLKRLVPVIVGLLFVIAAMTSMTSTAPAATAAAAKPKAPVLPAGVTATYVSESSALAPPPGYYMGMNDYAYLVNAHSGRCMGVSGSSQNNSAAIIQWTCNPSDFSDQRMDIYQVADTGARPWHLINPNHSTNKCLGVSGSSTARGTSLIQWTCHLQEHDQQYAFRVIDSAPNWVLADIYVRHSGLNVGVSNSNQNNGGRVIQWTHVGDSSTCTADQCWSFLFD